MGAPSPSSASAAGILEGATRLVVPQVNTKRAGPGRREKGEPFYNQGMALNRDLSVLLAEAEAQAKGREIDVGDALAGTGARSARLANEVESPLVVHANDGNPAAVAAILRTRKANGLGERLQAIEGDAHVFLASRRHDIVDVDPHGSPMPFLDAAVRATRPGGLVCVTATDTGALAGKFPRACARRYDAHHGLHAATWRAEVGLRILAGAVVRAAARFDRGAVPALTVAHGHWMRAVVRIGGGSGAADAARQGLGHAVLDAHSGNGHVAEGRPAQGTAPEDATRPWAGPLWTGPLHDADLVAAMRRHRAGKTLASPREVDTLLATMAQEAEAPAFWIVPDHLQKALGPTPRRDDLLARLAAAGHKAARTHMHPQGIRTDASLAQLGRVWQA